MQSRAIPTALADDDLDSATGGLTQHDLDNGRMIAQVGVAISNPAEFVVFQIGQKTADNHE